MGEQGVIHARNRANSFQAAPETITARRCEQRDFSQVDGLRSQGEISYPANPRSFICEGLLIRWAPRGASALFAGLFQEPQTSIGVNQLFSAICETPGRPLGPNGFDF